ncbi:hypothetical protein Ccrd_024294 [Cynara cardunculus var. scolymus]|uniref:Uncharacterized protein n=1 Tax=Cynara cardunculus var. scolymus TaxID=59895 RepID=A0A103XCL8_CYNCS|nr:hypothetical protein Ccrd_024294 [Cynara cardunculus var. scolymus]
MAMGVEEGILESLETTKYNYFLGWSQPFTV